MWQQLQAAWAVITDLFLDGFCALLIVAVAGPLIGVLLVLRRMPLLGLAIPQLAGCGQAATYFFYGLAMAEAAALPEPSSALQLIGSLVAVAVGLVGLVALVRDRRFLGVHAGVLFLFAIALRELFLQSSPYHAVHEESVHYGRLLTVDAGGMLRVAVCGIAVVGCVVARWRRMWISSFDADQATLLGISPRRELALTMLLLGALCTLCVPVTGAEVVLTLMLVPAALLRGAAPSLAAFPWLAVLAGVSGSVLAFVLACAEAVDWPPGVAVVVCVTVVSALLAGLLRLLQRRRESR